MIKVTNILLAKRVIVDKQYNSISIIDLVDDIILAYLPNTLTESFYLLFFERDINKDSTIVNLQSTLKFNGRTILEVPTTINFIAHSLTKALIATPIIPLEEEGLLVLEIYHESKMIYEYKIPVFINKELYLRLGLPTEPPPDIYHPKKLK